MRIALLSLLLTSLSATLAGSCTPDQSNPDEPVEDVPSALTDTFRTPVVGSDPVVAIRQNVAFVVWLAETTDGINVAGQLFSTTTGRPASISRVLTHSNHPKAHLQVAASSAGFFYVYEDVISANDHDILGGTMSPTGTTTAAAFISTSRDLDTSPALTYVPQIGKYHVSYIRFIGGPLVIGQPPPITSIRAAFVNTNGVPEQEVILQDSVTPSFDVFGNLTAAASTNGSFTIAYTKANTVFFQSLNSANPTARITAIPQGTKVNGISLTYNAAVDRFAVISNDNLQSLKVATFTPGCLSSFCISPVTTVATVPSTATSFLGVPSLAPIASSFVATFAVTPPNNEFTSAPMAIVAKEIDSNGNVNGFENTSLFPSCPTTPTLLPPMTSLGAAGSSSVVMAVFEPRCDGSPNVFGARLTESTLTPFPVSDVSRSYYALPFDDGDHRSFVQDPLGDWAQNQYKAECGVTERVSGISSTSFLTGSTLFGHSALCIEPPVPIGTTRNAYSFANGGQRGDTFTGPWDAGFSMAECGIEETVTGIARFPGAGLGTLLCADVSGSGELPDSSHCTTLTFSLFNNNQLDTSQGDWASGFIKNECGANQQLKGVSMVPSTGEIHAILCCNIVR